MHFLSLLVLVPLAAAVPSSSGTPWAKRAEPAPLLGPQSASSAIAGQYIIKFHKGSAMSIIESSLKHLMPHIEHVYEGILTGFAAKLSDSHLESIRGHPEIAFIEKDSFFTSQEIVSASHSTWGLGRISHRQVGSHTYVYDSSAGQGTCIYIVDSGLDASLPDFGGRAELIRSFVPESNEDQKGHGTHVAGTAGSNTYGVARNAQILGVKVLDANGRGANSRIIAGMDYAVTDSKSRSCPKGALMNLSLGGSQSQAMNEAVKGIVDSGFFVGVAAGNENQNASDVSPASSPYVCTVGGTARNDMRYVNSNWGPDVNISAPGVDVLSLKAGGGTTRKTGTSMATPHVVGLAAYLGSLEGIKGTDALCKRIVELGTKDAITDQRNDTVNLLAFNGANEPRGGGGGDGGGEGGGDYYPPSPKPYEG